MAIVIKKNMAYQGLTLLLIISTINNKSEMHEDDLHCKIFYVDDDE